MALADELNPRPQGGDRVAGWKNWVQSSQGRAALMQFGLNLAQPMGAGQNELGHIGAAVGAGGEAADRVTIADMEQRRQEQEREDQLAREALQQQRFEATHGLAREQSQLARERHGLDVRQWEENEPLRQAQTANYLRRATTTGGTGTLTREMRQVNMIRDPWDTLVAENFGSPPPHPDDPEKEWSFEEYLRSRNVDPEHFAEIERRAFELEQRAQAAAQSQGEAGAPAAGGGPSGAPAVQQPASPTTEVRPTDEVLADISRSPEATAMMQQLIAGLKRGDPNAEVAKQRLLAKVTDKDKMERIIDEQVNSTTGTSAAQQPLADRIAEGGIQAARSLMGQLERGVEGSQEQHNMSTHPATLQAQQWLQRGVEPSIVVERLRRANIPETLWPQALRTR